MHDVLLFHTTCLILIHSQPNPRRRSYCGRKWSSMVCGFKNVRLYKAVNDI